MIEVGADSLVRGIDGDDGHDVLAVIDVDGVANHREMYRRYERAY